ncbi:MAG: hypothetical protein H7175_14585, partial [Burkholderiales bacterium]|nr:hypothetical protein [Anaerolineae bacterium]
MSDDDRRNDADDFEDDDAIEGDIPDWLSEVAPIGDDDSDDDDSADWLSELSDAGADVGADLDAAPDADRPEWMPDELSAAEAGVPDWLSEMTPPETVDVYAVVNSPEYGAIDDAGADDLFALDDTDVTLEEADALDWMADTDPSGEFIEGDIDLESLEDADDVLVPGDVPDWLSEMQVGTSLDADEPMPLETEALGELTPNADTPDWLSAIQDENADELEPVPMIESQGGEGIVEDTPDWLTDEEPIAVGDMPDWLSEVSPDVDEAVEEEVPETEAAVPDWLGAPISEDSGVEAPPDAAADLEPVPGWLEEDADTLEPAQEGGYAEIPESGFDADAVETAAELEAEAVAEVPDWLAEVAPESEPELVLENEIAEYETDEGELEPVIYTDEGDQAEFIEEETVGAEFEPEVPLVASIEAPPMPDAMPEGIPEVAVVSAAEYSEPGTEFVYIETVQPGEPVETPETYVAAETLPEEMAE